MLKGSPSSLSFCTLYLFVELEACLSMWGRFFLDFSALSAIKCLCIGPVTTVCGHSTLLLGGENSRWSTAISCSSYHPRNLLCYTSSQMRRLSQPGCQLT